MKKYLFVWSVLFLLATTATQAQTGTAYFAGKWKVLLKGIPNGDATVILSLDKKGESLSGVLTDESGNKVADLNSVTVKGDTLTVFFFAEGHDVDLTLTKKDKNKVTGTLVNMFEAEGERVTGKK